MYANCSLYVKRVPYLLRVNWHNIFNQCHLVVLLKVHKLQLYATLFWKRSSKKRGTEFITITKFGMNPHRGTRIGGNVMTALE
jgi:hypothetical protein